MRDGGTRARTTRRRIAGSAAAASIAVALVSVLLSSCGGPAATESGSPADAVGTPAAPTDAGPPQAGGQLVYGLNADTNSFDPSVGQWSSSSYSVANAIYDPLAAIGEDGSVHPYLAESITSNSDFTAWTIALRPGIQFHDGSELDAEAVALNLETMRQSALVGAAFSTVEEVSVVDDLTVDVSFSRPWSTFPAALSGQPGYMAAPSMLESPDPATADPIGTGPFRFVSWIPGDELRVVKNESYWQEGLPHLDEIHYKVIADSTSRGTALAAGDVDVIEVYSSDLLGTMMAEQDGGEIQMLGTAGSEMDESVIVFNTAQSPFDDLTARKAVAYAVDQKQIAEQAYDGLYPAAWGNFEEDSPYYISPEEAGYPTPDPDKARELASQYQRDHGEPLSFTFQVGPDTGQIAIAQLLQDNLRSVGIEMRIDSVETTTLIAKVIGGNYEASTFLMWSTPTLDKGYVFIATEPTPEGLSLNHTRLFDPELTAAMDRARATGDVAAQTNAWAAVQKRMAANLDRIFLVHPRYAIAMVSQVHGFTEARFPGTDQWAFSPTITNPFFTEVWIEQH